MRSGWSIQRVEPETRMPCPHPLWISRCWDFFNLGPRAFEMLRAPRYLNPALAIISGVTKDFSQGSKLRWKGPTGHCTELPCQHSKSGFGRLTSNHRKIIRKIHKNSHLLKTKWMLKPKYKLCAVAYEAGGRGGRPPPRLKKFRANSVFRASSSCSKILKDKQFSM